MSFLTHLALNPIHKNYDIAEVAMIITSTWMDKYREEYGIHKNFAEDYIVVISYLVTSDCNRVTVSLP
jgi:hypothetical protein